MTLDYTYLESKFNTQLLLNVTPDNEGKVTSGLELS